jgi:hypothetical protein
MSLEDFDAHVKLLDDEVALNVDMSSRRCEQVMHPEMTAAIRIRVLAGGNYDDILVSGYPTALIW